jgi:general stress protein CsbA
MLLTGKKRRLIAKYAYLETLIIVGLYLAIGYWIDPQDICLMESSISFLTILLAVVTLFHGVASGLLAVMLIGVAMKFGYTEFSYQAFLALLVLVLIFGEFHYYWKRTISQHQTEAIFTRQKLEEMSKAFYMLKISHDQIERSYIVKPMSIRNSIRLVKEEYNNGERERFYHYFIQMLKENFSVNKAILVKLLPDGKYEILASSQEDEPFDSKDLMVESALKKKTPIYVSSSDRYSASRYLAVLPAIVNDKVIGLLAIESMPFMSFNKDALVSITVLTGYIFNEAHKLFVLQKIKGFLPEFQENLRFETHRLKLIHQNYGVESTLLVFRSRDRLAMHQLKDTIYRNRRSLDIVDDVRFDGVDTIVALFPFADISAVEGFLERIGKHIDLTDGSGTVEVGRFLMSQLDLALNFIYLERQ